MTVNRKEYKEGEIKDESVDSFFKRRLGSYVAETFAAPLCVGIYGGDSRKLSLRFQPRNKIT
jgi:protoporphyrinogen oxidase